MILLITFIISSCYSSKKINTKLPTEDSIFSFEEVNGTYVNSNDSSFLSLWELLYQAYSFRGYRNEISKTGLVKLNFINEEELSIQLIENNETIDEFYLKGKLKDNYFNIRRKFLLIPTFPLIYLQFDYKFILSQSDKGDLRVKRGFAHYGWILINGTGVHSIHSLVYNKKTK